MILVYNLGGLLIGIAGIIAGFFAVLLSGKLFLGLLVIAVIWLAFGRGKLDPQTGAKRPAPALFFVPLFYLAFPVLLLAVPAGLIELQGSPPRDQRHALLKADEKALDGTKLTGDLDLAGVAYDAVAGPAHDDRTHVFAATSGDRVLILVKIPTLKELDDSDRKSLLKKVADALQSREAAKGGSLYIGLKGRLAFGAIQTPAGVKVGKLVVPDPLLDFYSTPAPIKPTESAPVRQDAAETSS
jgi:hypothetical protein